MDAVPTDRSARGRAAGPCRAPARAGTGSARRLPRLAALGRPAGLVGRSVGPLVAAPLGIAPAGRNRRHCRGPWGGPGIWLLHGAYAFGCTALADDGPDGPVLRRTLDWPFPGLGRLVEVVHQRGPAGDFLNVTWPGFTGVLTAVAPGRFAASINQAPMRRRTTAGWLLWLDYALNAVAAFFSSGRPPPEHSLRIAFETCATFDEACRFLETTPVARPVLFLVAGCAPGERVLIERDGDDARVYRDRTVVANAWRDRSDGWRPRVCGEGTPVENNRRRVAAMAACTGRHPPRSRVGDGSRRERVHPRRRRDVRGKRPLGRRRLGGEWPRNGGYGSLVMFGPRASRPPHES